VNDSARNPFLVFGAPLIGAEEAELVLDCLERGWLGTGPKVSRFESMFAAYKDAPHAVAVNSCTAALQLSMLAAGIEAGDEVITTPLTFCATVNAIIHAGATPVLADVDPETMNIDPAAIEAAITPRTAAIVPVHFAGRPCVMDAIATIADRHGLVVIEDCAHAIETERDGVKAGTAGAFGCFSFYATKNVATGEGGMILTRNGDDADRLKRLALHGMSTDAWARYGDDGYKHYDVVEAGFKCNMMDIQAALGIPQLARVDENWARREVIWGQYDRAFAALPVTTPAPPEPDSRHAYHLYTLLVDAAQAGVPRDAFLGAMTRRGIGVGVHYRSVAEHPYYQQRFGWRPEDQPHATRIGRRTVSVPLSPKLTDRDVKDVIAAVCGIIEEAATRRAARVA
jgi:dTDP-4-amino-4,6-dideoxygalactose transaminase